MAYNNINPIAIDLFCGAGGLSLGLEHSNIDVVLGVEIDSKAANTYRNNHDGVVFEEDVRNVTGEHILQEIGLDEGELFLLAGCPPCQTFSSLQKDDVSNDDRNNLIFEYTRLILEIRPLFILMENVPGLKNGRGRHIFEEACNRLHDNYEIVSKVLNCADYGVPQSRKRLVIHGVRRDVYNLLLQNDNNFKVTLPNAMYAQNPNDQQHAWVTAGEVLQGLPEIAAGETAPEEYPNHETNGLSDINIERIRYIRQHGGSRNCLPERLQLSCHKKKNVGYGGVYGIIDPDKPAPTMTGGCICYTKGRFGHPTQDRAITVREAARFQSFPDDYVFEGSRGDTALQVGNAVPPRLAEASGRYFMGLLNTIYNL